jgi:dolichol-phosphate mannosyltransferase
MKGKTLVIIPTYDEKDNVGPIAEAVFAAVPDVDVLFVDDDSPDGTGAVLDGMAARDPRVHVLHHGAKAGLGRAYVAGFKWGLERGYGHFFEMDADGSHDPKAVPAFLKAAENADLVLGTRYKGGIRVIDWPLNRLLLSMGAGVFVRLVTGLPVSDPTGGYKCYSAEVLRAIDLDKIVSNGYSFQMETTFTAWTKGFRIAEVPIVFLDRRVGYSKLSLGIAREAFCMVFRLAWRNRFRRRPRFARPAPAAAAPENGG